MVFQNFIINKNAVANFADIIYENLNVTVKVGGNRMSKEFYTICEKDEIKKENELILESYIRK